jgi:hypothetical protein
LILAREKEPGISRIEVIPLDASLVRGSHGCDRLPEGERPVLLGTREKVDTAADIHRLIIDLFTGRREA